MTVLFGAHDLAGTPTGEAVRNVLGRMGERAGLAAGPSQSTPTATFSGTDGVAFGVCQHVCVGMAPIEHFAQAPQVWLAMQGRLDGKPELASRLNLPATSKSLAADPLNPPMSDADLVMAAYERFGADCVQFLAGDWAFALWDASRQRLLLARDATGNSALFWWQGRRQLLFASSLPTLLAAGPVPKRPDRRWLAGLLTVFTDPAYPGATAFQDVHAVPPGHLLIVERGQVKLERWWTPEKLAPVDDAPLPELEARFLAIYREAVRERLSRRCGTVGLFLSGGLDSGSVASLAAPALAAQGQRLTGYVHVPRFNADDANPGRTCNEWALAQATAHHVGNVDCVSCPTEALSPVDGIRRWLDMAASPSHAAVNWYWLLDITSRAANAGTKVLLTGQGGNSTVSFDGTGDLWPALRTRGLRAVIEEIRRENSGPIGAIRTRLIKPALRPLWNRTWRTWSARRAGLRWSQFGWLTDSLAQELRLEESMRSAGHDPAFITQSAARLRLFRLGLLGGADNGSAAWSELSAAHCIDIRDPTRDRRLVELCWAMPDALFWAHGRRRGLIRSTMRDSLPAAVLDCHRKGQQSADVILRLRACADELRDEATAVARLPQVREWIDTHRLGCWVQSVLDESIAPNGRLAEASHGLRTLSAAMFIARHA